MQRETFDAHPLWRVLNEVDGQIRQATDDADEEADHLLGQLRYVVAQLRAHEDPVDTVAYAETRH